MQNLLLTCLLVLIISFNLIAQVGINTLTPNAKSALDVTSTSQGFLPPRMTEAQRIAISSPVPAGLMVWCIDCGVNGQMQVFNGITWTDMVGGPAAVGPFICGTSTVSFTYNGSPVTYGTVVSAGECWLDRNLGASQVATSSVDANAYGDQYQWGRRADGHQIRGSYVPDNLSISNTDTPPHGLFIYTESGYNYDWRWPQNTNLWQGVNGVNNPCPTGFRAPTSSEINAEMVSWGVNQNPLGAFNSPLKLPLTGWRSASNGVVFYVGTYGYYWSSTYVGNQSTFLLFGLDPPLPAEAGIFNGERGEGFSVRCIKD